MGSEFVLANEHLNLIMENENTHTKISKNWGQSLSEFGSSTLSLSPSLPRLHIPEKKMIDWGRGRMGENFLSRFFFDFGYQNKANSLWICILELKKNKIPGS